MEPIASVLKRGQTGFEENVCVRASISYLSHRTGMSETFARESFDITRRRGRARETIGLANEERTDLHYRRRNSHRTRARPAKNVLSKVNDSPSILESVVIFIICINTIRFPNVCIMHAHQIQWSGTLFDRHRIIYADPSWTRGRPLYPGSRMYTCLTP